MAIDQKSLMAFFHAPFQLFFVLPESTTTLVSSDEPDAIFVNTQAASN